MFIAVLFLAVVLIASCMLPDFSITQIASIAFSSEPAKGEKKNRVPMRMPRARKCKVAAVVDPQSSAIEE